jgi:hypothetical protein
MIDAFSQLQMTRTYICTAVKASTGTQKNKSMGLRFSDSAWVGDRAISPCSLNNPKDDDSAMDHSIDQILHIKDHIVGACADR